MQKIGNINSENIQRYIVDADNAVYASENGILLSKDKTQVIKYPGAATAFSLPESVTSIGTQAFSLCTSLPETITIPERVTDIGDEAFLLCSVLKKVVFEAETLSLGEYVFLDCTDLLDVTVYAKTVTVNDSGEDHTFTGCSDDLVITCYKGSGMDTYAVEKGIAVEYIVVEDILGDIDGDGELTVADVLTSLRAVLAGDLENAPDMNGDGKVSLLDILRMLKKMVA